MRRRRGGSREISAVRERAKRSQRGPDKQMCGSGLKPGCSDAGGEPSAKRSPSPGVHVEEKKKELLLLSWPDRPLQAHSLIRPWQFSRITRISEWNPGEREVHQEAPMSEQEPRQQKVEQFSILDVSQAGKFQPGWR